MGLFDDTWTFDAGVLRRVGNPAMQIQTQGGLVLNEDMDLAMGEMGFEFLPGKRSDGYLAYTDAHHRRMQDRVVLGFPFPPKGIRWENIRENLDSWEQGPDNDGLIVFIGAPRRP